MPTRLEANDILIERQYGFRKNRSTRDLLAFTIHIKSEAIERNGEMLAVSLDISRALTGSVMTALMVNFLLSVYLLIYAS